VLTRALTVGRSPHRVSIRASRLRRLSRGTTRPSRLVGDRPRSSDGLRALDLIAPECNRLALAGTSFGAEAALLVASLDDRVGATVAFAPSAYVWGGYDGDHWTSHWTWRGEPLPYVPFCEDWEPESDPPAYREFYAQSLAVAGAEVVAAATIPAEQILGPVVLVAGGDDQVWPSADFAAAISLRRKAAGLPTSVVMEEAAGHRAVLPGESPVADGQRMQRGGTDAGDRALGAQAWPHVVDALALDAP
jgi:dienelactone hydrolase